MWGRIVLFSAILLVAGSGWGGLHAAGSGSPTNDRLLALSPSQQARILTRGIKGCVGTSAFPMGVVSTAKWKSLAYWSVRCKNGKSYVVQVSPIAKAPAAFEDCSVLNGTGKECFKKF